MANIFRSMKRKKGIHRQKPRHISPKSPQLNAIIPYLSSVEYSKDVDIAGELFKLSKSHIYVMTYEYCNEMTEADQKSFYKIMDSILLPFKLTVIRLDDFNMGGYNSPIYVTAEYNPKNRRELFTSLAQQSGGSLLVDEGLFTPSLRRFDYPGRRHEIIDGYDHISIIDNETSRISGGIIMAALWSLSKMLKRDTTPIHPQGINKYGITRIGDTPPKNILLISDKTYVPSDGPPTIPYKPRAGCDIPTHVRYLRHPKYSKGQTLKWDDSGQPYWKTTKVEEYAKGGGALESKTYVKGGTT